MGCIGMKSMIKIKEICFIVDFFKIYLKDIIWFFEEFVKKNIWWDIVYKGMLLNGMYLIDK